MVVLRAQWSVGCCEILQERFVQNIFAFFQISYTEKSENAQDLKLSNSYRNEKKLENTQPQKKHGQKMINPANSKL